MKLYALAISARSATHTQIKADAVLANNENEAVGIGVGMAKGEWPIDKGWGGHAAAICLIPSEYCNPDLSRGPE